MSNYTARKRALSSREKDTRIRLALDEVKEKNSVGFQDKLHEYVLCFHCINNGFPQKAGYKGNLSHRRDRLKSHYQTYHPGESLQEWESSDAASQPKQMKLSQMFVTKSTHSKDDTIDESLPIDQQQDVMIEADANSDSEADDESSDELLVQSTPTTPNNSVQTKDEAGTFSFVRNFMGKILSAVETVQNTCSEGLSLLKELTRNHRVNRNPFLMQVGTFCTINNDIIEIDDIGIKKALATCKNIEQVFVCLPFLSLSDSFDKIICEFCPDIELTYYAEVNESSKRFSNTKKVIHCHVTRHKHKENMLAEYKKQEDDKVILSKDEKAGMTVFRSVYGGLKMGYSFKEIIREISVLHYNKVLVGDLNHSKGTIARIKDVIARVLRQKLRSKLNSVLPCTGKLRPVMELFDKMTHFHRTGQMQLAIVPMMNDTELLTAVYLDNYLIDPDENKYKDMIDMVRETGNSYYLMNQVESGSADGAYAKNANTQQYYQDCLEVDNNWINLKWDFAHLINLSEEDARKNSEIEINLDLAQEITKLFRRGKEYVEIFGHPEVRCVSLTDEMPSTVSEAVERPDQSNAEVDMNFTNSHPLPNF